MRIGLIDVDNQRIRKHGAKLFPNLALCKIAAYHKAKGDIVEWASQMEHYDILYKAKVFTYTPDDTNVYKADKLITGGTGYDIHSRLPEDIDSCCPDYSIYPSIPGNVAYGFLTRGCPNHCPWCVVPRKEGAIRPYKDVCDVATDGRDHLILMDNNILASGAYAHEQLRKIIEHGYHVDFNQALDARLVDDDFARELAAIKWINRTIRFGCDTPRQIDECDRVITMLQLHGYKGKVLLYTIITPDFYESYTRINYWRIKHKWWKGIEVNTHSQPYRALDSNNEIEQWQKDLATWSNKHMLVNIPFADYMPRKGFYCRTYFDASNKA